MKVLVNKITNEIMFISNDIELREVDGTNDMCYCLKNEAGEEFDHIVGDYYIFDTGENEELAEELANLENPGLYCIVDGVVKSKNDYILCEINRAKRETTELIKDLELNQIELLYEMSLLQLGLPLE